MCGIVLVKKEKGVRACKTVFKRFNKQRERGLLGFGYIAVEDGKVVSIKRAKYEPEIRELMMKETASEILFHHRNPSGGQENFVGLAHPIVVQNDAFDFDYVVVHNGTIVNSDELKKEHEELGFEYNTEYKHEKETKTEVSESIVFNNGFIEKDKDVEIRQSCEKNTKYNDSEALAYELALYCEGWKDSIDTTGGVATILYQLKKDGTDGVIGATVNKLFYTRNYAKPLVLETHGKKRKKNGMAIIKSEGAGREINENRMYSLDYSKDLSKVTSETVKLGKYHSYYNNHTHNIRKVETQNVHKHTPEKVVEGFGNIYHKSDKNEFSGVSRPAGEDFTDPVGNGVYDDEMRLISELEEQEAMAWQQRAEEIVEKIEGLYEDLVSMEKATEEDPYDYDTMANITDTKCEIRKLQEEFLGVQDKLIELELPIPSTIPFTIAY